MPQKVDERSRSDRDPATNANLLSVLFCSQCDGAEFDAKTTHPIASNKDVLVKVKVWHEVGDERMHLFLVAECEERNQTHQCLQHGGVSTNKWTVDTIKQHYQLLLVATQL